MRILVTGGAGFIGGHIVDAALAAGHEVLALDDLSTGRAENVAAPATLERVDLRDAAAVERVVAEFKPHAVSHQGAQTSVSKSVREAVLDAQINVLGTLHLLEALGRHGVRRLVFASTGGAIYGEVPEGTRAAVDGALAPLSPYACSKLAGEAYVRAYARQHHFGATVLRYANVYGPRQDPHGEAGVVAIFAQRLLANEPIWVNAKSVSGDDGCVRDYVYVEDVVRLNLAALEGHIAAPIVNVCTGEETCTGDLASAMKSSCASSSEVRFGAPRAGDLERSVLEPPADESLRARIGLAEGLARTVTWFRAKHA
jgi:UDP-glucose 4-epimerase